MVAPAAAVARLRHGPADLRLVALAFLQGLLSVALLKAAATGRIPPLMAAILLAAGMWWNANTIAHIHLHTPLFRGRQANRAFSLYLGVLTGLPQSLWRSRHLWHHAGEPRDRPWRVPARLLAAEVALIALSWIVLAGLAPSLIPRVLVPGYLLGLLLCQLHGHFEHAGAGTAADPGVSVYHGWYNRLWLNDGYHAEHHRAPGLHWSLLPARRRPDTRASRWPPVLRWLDGLGPALNRLSCAGLVILEKFALRLAFLRRFALRRHARALRLLLAAIDPAGEAPRRVAIVGGGLYPRTALALRGLLPPRSELVVIEDCAEHIERARACLAAEGLDPGAVTFLRRRFSPEQAAGYDLLIIPLGYRGDREAIYRHPPAPLVLVHDWLWRRRGQAGRPVSALLLKRINLLRAEPRA